eukprot:Nitzschia sp. Nitz4//scaffold273_size25297//20719//24905//NITZ4_008321-RA/size25297-processed-gene-0.7-mRNA-1//-1//CDS//3329545262//6417//frame0
MPRLLQEFTLSFFRSLTEEASNHTDDGYVDDHVDDGEHHSEFGVHITYDDLYDTVVFLVAIYVSGEFARRVLQMPSLVGEIFCGIILGPPVLEDFIPNPEAWVMFGELGLILLVIEAGIDIDLSTLKLIGSRGFLIAFIGSILPIGIGMLIAYLLNVADTKGTIAAGAVFGPTSLGIALNILRSGGVLNTPVGQLIVSAAVIDDMIALVVLSQLEALVGELSVSGVLIPVVSALGFLIIGGYAAIFLLPPLIHQHILKRCKHDQHDRIEMGIMFFLVLVLMPATYYGKASYLMGCFVAGLTFCSSHEVHAMYVRQFKRVLQWLMRIFFAASIGFQVPIKDFADGTVIWQGLVFTLALLGKVAVGFLVPNFTQASRYTENHLRDCLITGFSMAAEGEFAFVIAVFAVDAGLISADLYASVVLAVLLSTIIPPFLLRFTISYYNKRGQEKVELAAEQEEMRQHTLGHSVEESLVQGIRNKSTVFLCIQTQSNSRWGLLHALMQVMGKKGLDIIDHRAWSPRGINTTLVNEVYGQAHLDLESHPDPKEALEILIEEIKTALEATINQPDVAKVKVQRWFPGVVEEIVEEVNEKRKGNVTQRLLSEASSNLERKQQLQTGATTKKTVAEILGYSDVEKGNGERQDVEGESTDKVAAELSSPPFASQDKPKRRVRQKMRSTPVVGGGLFGETIEAKSGRDATSKIGHFASPAPNDMKWNVAGKSKGISAEISVKGEVFNIRISRETYKDLLKGFSGQMVDSRGLTGGALIGLSAGLLLIFNGDVLGASGIMNSVFTTPHETLRDPEKFWKSVVLCCFLVTSSFLLGPSYAFDSRTSNDPTVPIISGIGYALAGLLVGFGTKLGNGCTSGHGVCGLGRQSPRSFVAVLAFMTTSIMTVALTSPESFAAGVTAFLRTDTVASINPVMGASLTIAVVVITVVGYVFSRAELTGDGMEKVYVGGLCGGIFATGLAISQMVLGSKLFGFLNVAGIPTGEWDPTLITVLGAAVTVSTIAYQFVDRFSIVHGPNQLAKPVVSAKFSIPTRLDIDRDLVVGSAIFGVGWGIGLLCPGPALFQAAAGNTKVLFLWLPAYAVGAIAATQYKKMNAYTEVP